MFLFCLPPHVVIVLRVAVSFRSFYTLIGEFFFVPFKLATVSSIIKIEKKDMFNQCLYTLIQNGPDLHELFHNFSDFNIFWRLISNLQYLCPFCISVHRYTCTALVSVYTDTERPLIIVNITYPTKRHEPNRIKQCLATLIF